MDPLTQLRADLITALALTPADGETEVADSAILAKVTELVSTAGTAAETGTSLAAAQAELETLRAQYQELFAREETARKQMAEAAADEILAQYADRIRTPEAKAHLRALLLDDKAAAIQILDGLAVGTPAAAEPPPEPVHQETDTEGGEGLTAEQKIAEANKLIAELRKTKAAFQDYESARNEIRRRRPDLFA